MTKLEIQAIKALPDEYVKDGTCVAQSVADGEPIVVAMETNLPPIIFKDGKWNNL